MSSKVEVVTADRTQRSTVRWSLWRQQVAAIMRLEVKKNFFSKRSVLVYLLAMMPIGLIVMVEVLNPLGRDITQYQAIFSLIYNTLLLRTVVFFGCAWIFMNLFRGEIVDRSLHYYFLSSVRREVLVFGKYISGLLTSIVLFSSVTVVSMLLVFFSHSYAASAQFFLDGAGLTQLLTYARITMLPCNGLGGFSLVMRLII